MRRIRRVHFVGIGGVGMCGIAELLHRQEYRVTGSDLRDGSGVERLRSLGVPVALGHSADHVADADVVVVSTAIPAGNSELTAARQRGIPTIARAEMLAELMRLKDGIAVAGSHGKTTTASLIAHVLQAAGLDPSAVIGGRLRNGERSGTRVGRGDLLVAEADESDGSFLRLAPVIAVVTNVDREHIDHYGSMGALRESFASFINRIPFWGTAVLCIDDVGVQELLPRAERRVVTYGLSPQADLYASDVAGGAQGLRFAVRREGELLGTVSMPLAGSHNAQNAVAALAVALEVEIPFAVAAAALADFPGIERRFETLGEVAGIRVLDDYGHHPAEIRATLAAARECHRGRIAVVFQPHRYTRTRDLADEFATAFHGADRLIVTEVYAAGEEKIPGIDAAMLTAAIAARGHRDVRCVAEPSAVPGILLPDLRAGDWVLTLGAGSIAQLGPALLRALRERVP